VREWSATFARSRRSPPINGIVKLKAEPLKWPQDVGVISLPERQALRRDGPNSRQLDNARVFGRDGIRSASNEPRCATHCVLRSRRDQGAPIRSLVVCLDGDVERGLVFRRNVLDVMRSWYQIQMLKLPIEIIDEWTELHRRAYRSRVP
jgi:hypothetical protein